MLDDNNDDAEEVNAIFQGSPLIMLEDELLGVDIAAYYNEEEGGGRGGGRG